MLVLVLDSPGGRDCGEKLLEFSQGLGAGGGRPPPGALTGTRSQCGLGVRQRRAAISLSHGQNSEQAFWVRCCEGRKEGAVVGTVPPTPASVSFLVAHCYIAASLEASAYSSSAMALALGMTNWALPPT